MKPAAKIIAKAERIGALIERPAHFTNHEHCCECQDHDDELQPYTPATIPRKALGHMGWDPITFCTDHAFRYWLPGLIRIALTETGEDAYYEQLLWHLNYVAEGYDRIASCSIDEREVVLEALNWLLEHRSEDIERECASEDLFSALERWSAGADELHSQC